MPLHYT